MRVQFGQGWRALGLAASPMDRSATLGTWLVTAGLSACSSDTVVRSAGDAGDASATSGSGGALASTGGAAGAAGSGDRGGSATGGSGGNAGRPASGGSASAGKGGHAGSAGAGCTYGGASHPPGSTFPSTDGCNMCMCSATGMVSCTKRACIPDAGGDASGPCMDTPAARLCVHGPTTTSAGEPLKVGDRLRITVEPRGCFSSSCTRVQAASCSVSGTMSLTVDAHFCIGSSAGPGVGCTADCAGAGYASCAPTGALMAGQYTVKLGAFSVTFSVPGVLPVGGECIGSPF